MRELSASIDLTAEDLDYIAARLAGINPLTRRTYARELVRFSAFFAPAGGGRLSELDRFLSLDAPAAHGIVWSYREQMMMLELGPATINLRLSAVRALVKRAQQVGEIVWSLEVPGLEPPPSRMYAVTPADVALLISELSTGPASYEPRRARDACAIRLTWDLGLRRHELLALDLGDVDLTVGTLAIRFKGRSDKQKVQLPERSQNAIVRWLDARRGADLVCSALFVGLESVPVERLSARGYYGAITRRTRQILGRPVPPHGIRHAAITCALESTNGNVARVAGYARHSDIRTTMHYDDLRRNHPGRIAQLVSDSVPEPPPSATLANSASSSRISAFKSSVGFNFHRNSAARSAARAASRREGFGGTFLAPIDSAAGVSCAACGAGDPGPEGWTVLDDRAYCAGCVLPGS